MSKTPRKTLSYDDLEYYSQELARLRELNREAEMSRMLQSSTRNRKPANNAEMNSPAPIRINPPSPILTKILNIPIPGQSKQPEKYDGEGLPPPPGSKKSSSSKKKQIEKQIEEITPQIINARNLPRALHPSVHTLMSLNPRARRRTTTFTKSKGGKNKTKKRKAKKTKKNKKTKK